MAEQRSKREREDAARIEQQFLRDNVKLQSDMIKTQGDLNVAEAVGDANRVRSLTNRLKGMEQTRKKRQEIIANIRQETDAEDELTRKLKAKSQIYNDLANTLKNIPGIGGLISDVFTEAAKVTEKTGSRLMGMLSIFDSIARVAGPAAILKSMLDISNQTQDISRNLGVGFKHAREIRQEFAQIAMQSNDVRINSIDLVKAQGQLISSLGLSVKASGEVSQNFIRNSEYLGASVEAAGNLERIIAVTGGNSTQFADSLALAANETGKTYGINLPLAKVIEKINNLQGATLGYLMESPEALARAVAMSEKLGVEFSKIRSIADGLVNFQSSITSEVEAEVLLNRNLNLEKARALAFRGDEVGLAEELSKQIGTLSDFNSMLPIQQESFAKALGMSRDEMANMLMQQELSVRFGAQARDLSNEQLQAAKELADSEGISDAAALRRVQEQVSASKQFEDAAQKIRGAFQDAVVRFTPIIEKVAALVGKLASNPFAQILTIGAAGIGTIFAAIKAITGSSPLTPMYTREVGLGGAGGRGLRSLSLGGKSLSGAQMAKIGGIGIAGALAGQAISTNATTEGQAAFGGALSGAGMGASVGMLAGPYGAAAGAVLGAVYGGITGYLDKQEADREAKRMEYEQKKAQEDPIAREIKMMRQALENKETSISMDGQMLGKLQENRPYNGMNKPVLS